MPVTRINVEHKTARSIGGKNNKSNLVLACSNCNKEKGSKPLTPAKREVLNRQNKNLKGTYLKNKEHHNNLYGKYSDESIVETFNNIL